MEMDSKILKIVDVVDMEEEQVKKFLHKLKNYKIEGLKKEAQRIKDTVVSLDNTTQESAYNNYQAFINSSKSSRQVIQNWNDISNIADNLGTNVTNFTSKCDDFFNRAYELEKACDTLNLNKHAEILNILELPHLMEISIQKEDYDNALELASYIQKLNSKLPNVVLIESVIITIESSWHIMISQLLLEMRNDDLSLTKCLQLIGYLRRMQAFTLTELKMKFLQERGFWIEELLLKIEAKNLTYQYLIRTVEVTRVSLFNIITQYNALFNEDSSRDSISEKNTHLIISSWVHDKLEIFLKTLECSLLTGSVNISDIVAITSQCMYFGSSFSRIGYDFRGMIGPIFLRATIRVIKTSVIELTTQFEKDMEMFTLINRDVRIHAKKKSDGDEEEEAGKKRNKNHCPESILEFYPLAAYTNRLLVLFNELRVCVPLSCTKEFLSSINQSIEIASKCILSFFKNEQQAFSKHEKDNFLSFCTCFCYEFFPYIQKCINEIFQNNGNIESLLKLSNQPVDRLLHLTQGKIH